MSCSNENLQKFEMLDLNFKELFRNVAYGLVLMPNQRICLCKHQENPLSSIAKCHKGFSSTVSSKVCHEP